MNQPKSKYQLLIIVLMVVVAGLLIWRFVKPTEAWHNPCYGVKVATAGACYQPTEAPSESPVVTPTLDITATPSATSSVQQSAGDSGSIVNDSNSCTVKDCNTHPEDQVNNQSGIPLMPASNSGK